MATKEYKIRIKQEGLEKLLTDLAKADKSLNELRTKKVKIQANLTEVDTKITKLKNKLKDLTAKREEIKISGGNITKVDNQIKKISEDIKNLTRAKSYININNRDATQKIRELQRKTQEIKKELEEEHNFKINGGQGLSTLQKIQGALFSLGSAMQTAGNAMQNLAELSPFTSIVDSIEGVMSSGITNVITSGVSQIGQRYDDIERYKKAMIAMGESEEKTTEITNKLDESVRGLPTSLSAIMTSTKEYAGILEDWGKASDYAIGLNKIFIASGVDEMTRTQGMRQIRDLMTGASLRSEEWQSLQKSLTVTLPEIGKAYGYTTENMYEFKDALRSGKLETGKFLDALLKASNSNYINQLVEAEKQTITATISNARIAITRLGEGALRTLDDVMEETTGKRFTENLGGIRDVIDDLSKSLNNFIKTHPEEITEFFNKIKSFDWKGLVTSIGGFLKLKWGTMLSVLNLLGGKGVAWISVLGRSVGKFMTIFGGVLSAISKLGIVNFLFGGGKLGKIGNFMKNIALLPIKAFIKAINLLPAGKLITSKLSSFVNGMKGADKALSSVKSIDLAESIKNFKNTMMSLAKVGGAIAIVGEVGLVIYEFTKVFEAIDKTEVSAGFGKKALMIASGIGAVGVIVGALSVLASSSKIAGGALAIGELLTAGFVAVIAEIGFVIQEYTTVMNKINDARLPSNQKLKAFLNDVKELNGIFDISIFDYFFGFWGGITKYVKTAAMEKGAETIAKMATAFDKIAKVKMPKKDAINKVKEIKEMITEFINEFNGDFFKELFRKWQIDTYSDEVGAVTSIFSNIVKMVKNIYANAKTKVNKLKSAITKITIKGGLLSQVEALMTELRTRATEFVDNINNAGEEKGGGKNKSKGKRDTTFDTSSYKLQIERIKLVLQEISGVITELKKLQKEVNGKDGFDITSIKENGELYNVIDGITTFFTEYKTRILELSDLTEDLEDFNSDALIKFTRTIQKIVKGFAGITTGDLFSKKEGFIPSLLMPTGDSYTNFNEITSNIGEVITQLGKFVDDVNSIDITEETSEKVTLMNEVTAKLNMLIGKLNKLPSLNTDEKTAEDGMDIFDRIALGITTLNLALTNAENISDNITLLTDALSGLKKELSNGLVKALDTARGKIKGLGASVKGLGRTMNAQIKSITSFGNTIQQQGGKLDGLNAKVGNLTTSINNIPSNKNVNINATGISNALAGISQLSSSINELSGKTIRINTKGITDGINALQGKTYYVATGGYVQYRADGGTLFKRKGTDTVPAMLTPGEYVHNKRSVDAFGKRFMDKVNRVDVGGALRELMTKAGRNARVIASYPVSSRTINNNRTSTNNARVTQNIYTNNEKWSYKRANRYARGL